MRFALLACVCVALVATVAAGTNWAVLVAGSNGYYNYRHQADVCHAYQILKAQGFPDENIVVFMYDDIAESSQNPVKGNIINRPDGPNVYPGVPKDYTGADVTPKNFLDVLLGKGPKKNIHPTKDDKVFINFSDHGATGLIAFPNEYLYADDLMDVLKQMTFKELVFYLEACESGSMFSGVLPDNIHIFATTAANPSQSSYACYYDDSRQTYLGDVYSVLWMEDVDKQDVNTYTLKQNFDTVKAACNTSHVCAYGDLSIESEVLAEFMAYKKALAGERMMQASGRPIDVIDSRDVELAVARRLAKGNPSLMSNVDKILAHRARTDQAMAYVAKATLGNDWRVVTATNDDGCNSQKVEEWDCLKASVRGFEASCGKFDDYGLKYVSTLNTICSHHVDSATVARLANEVCSAH